MNKKIMRFQHCKWYIKLWRLRWFFWMPFYFIPGLINGFSQWKNIREANETWTDFVVVYWQMSVARIQIKMNWVYRLDEVEAKFYWD